MEWTRPSALRSAFAKRYRSPFRHFPRSSWNWRYEPSCVTDPTSVAGSVKNRVTRCTSAPTSQWQSCCNAPIRSTTTASRRPLTQSVATGSRHVEHTSDRVERASSPRDEEKGDRRRLCFTDTRHTRVLGRNGDQGDGRHAARSVFALLPAKLKMPAPLLN